LVFSKISCKTFDRTVIVKLTVIAEIYSEGKYIHQYFIAVSNQSKRGLSSSIKYGEQVKKNPKLTCIIGGRCKEGVILAGDWKITNDDRTFEFNKKVFMDYYPVVIASSGYTTQLRNFRREAKEASQNLISQPSSNISGPIHHLSVYRRSSHNSNLSLSE
jgi:hypothetical protein